MKQTLIAAALLCAGALSLLWLFQSTSRDDDGGRSRAAVDAAQEAQPAEQRSGPQSAISGPSESSGRRISVEEQLATLRIEVRDLSGRSLEANDCEPRVKPLEAMREMRFVNSPEVGVFVWEASVAPQEHVEVSLPRTPYGRTTLTESLETPHSGGIRLVALEVVIERGAPSEPFWVKLVAADGGGPLAGVGAELHTSTGRSEDLERAAVQSGWLVSDPEGLIKLEINLPRDAFLWVAPGEYSPAIVPLVGRHAVVEQALEVRLQRSASLNGSVQLSSGEDVGSLTVRVSAPYERLVYPANAAWMISGRGFQQTSQVNADGRFSRMNLPAGVHLQLALHQRDGAEVYSESILLAPEEERTVLLVVAGNQGIIGQVFDEKGRPMPGVEVKAGLYGGDVPSISYDKRYLRGGLGVTKVGVTDANGQYVLLGLQAGQWMVGLDPQDRIDRRAQETAQEFVSAWERVSVKDGGGLQAHDIRLEAGRFIRGRVIDGEGRPGAGASLLGFWQRQFPTSYVVADDEGRFELGPLMQGEYLVRVARDKGFLKSRGVLAHAGNDDVELRVERAGSIKINIYDPASSTSHRGEVRAFESDGEEPKRYVAWEFVHDEDLPGGVVLGTLVAGKAYDIVVATATGLVGLASRVKAEPGAAEGAASVNVEAAMGKELQVRNGSREEKDYRVVQGGMLVAHGTLGPGQQHVHFLMPSPGVVLWESNGERRESKLEAISPGAVEEVTIN